MPSGYKNDGSPSGKLFQKGLIPWNKNKKRFDINGEKHFRWKGGKGHHNKGYIFLLKPEHPYCNGRGYIFEHRLVIEKYLGRYINPKDVVHHINGIKDDNRIENLILFNSNRAHKKFELIQEGIKEGELIFDGRDYGKDKL